MTEEWVDKVGICNRRNEREYERFKIIEDETWKKKRSNYGNSLLVRPDGGR